MPISGIGAFFLASSSSWPRPFPTPIATRYADTPTDEGGTRPPGAWPQPRTALLMPSAAHRALPVGPRILIAHGDGFTICTVLDRGPYRATDRERDLFRGPDRDRAQAPRRHVSGDLDLSPNVARAPGHAGMDQEQEDPVPAWSDPGLVLGLPISPTGSAHAPAPIVI